MFDNFSLNKFFYKNNINNKLIKGHTCGIWYLYSWDE